MNLKQEKSEDLIMKYGRCISGLVYYTTISKEYKKCNDDANKIMAELLSRLEKGEDLERRLDLISEHAQYLFQRAYEIACEKYDLCCCGNCKFLVIFHKWKILCLNPESIQNEKEVLVCHYCDKWQSDGMTRSQREIK